MLPKFNEDERDRFWEWTNQFFDYSPKRLSLNKEYIGSYCMDALAMSLNILHYTSSFTEAVARAANIGGDADTVAAIVGAIAGAFYGLSPRILELYSDILKWDDNRIVIRAWKLINK